MNHYYLWIITSRCEHNGHSLFDDDLHVLIDLRHKQWNVNAIRRIWRLQSQLTPRDVLPQHLRIHGASSNHTCQIDINNFLTEYLLSYLSL